MDRDPFIMEFLLLMLRTESGRHHNWCVVLNHPESIADSLSDNMASQNSIVANMFRELAIFPIKRRESGPWRATLKPSLVGDAKSDITPQRGDAFKALGHGIRIVRNAYYHHEGDYYEATGKPLGFETTLELELASAFRSWLIRMARKVLGT